MSKEKFISAVGEIDESVFARYNEVEQKILKRAVLKKRVLRVVYFAACFCAFAGIMITAVRSGVFDIQEVSKPPVNEKLFFTAKEIASIFSGYESVGISSYETVYAPDNEYFSSDKTQYNEFATVYRVNDYGCPTDENEFKSFTDDITGRFAHYIDVLVPEYEIQDTFDTLFHLDEYTCMSRQTDKLNTFWLVATFNSQSNGAVISFEDRKITVDQTCSDEEIIKSLEQVKYILFDVFNVEFSEISVNRIYDNSANRVSQINVLFYNDTHHSLMNYKDYISLNFKPYDNSVYTKYFDCTHIYYQQFRFETDKLLSSISEIRQITVEEAEELLFKGYTFGGHSCPICMSEQKKVDFVDYDCVNIKYFNFSSQDVSEVYIPFYAFYKQIGVAVNGNIEYAVTYVPAIEVSGYEEYFENQKKNH